ncbi:M48 family metallopeptidase [Sorangium sp. So ce1389]|uniref:M48 family metallopeptidase n=1 Tax=Sorangium sp. So ce1389 TaxID=3133336 RepID=UPI003F62E04C
MKTTSLQEARFSGERSLHEQVLADEALKRELHRAEILRQRSMTRARLLSEAVRVNVRLLPNVAQSFLRLSRHVEGGKELEAYVFAESEINAFVTEGLNHLLVGVSSGAVSALSSEELEFVIGHELGHAVYGHLDVAANHLIESGNLDLERAQLVRSFQRAAEVSADRAGLVCCGSLEVAATAMFKTLSGLNVPGLKVDPVEFAQQWDHLVDEVVAFGRRDQWQLSHPFPPLRMRALLSFWRLGPGPAADDEVRRLLALMDAQPAPKADADDPFLARFLFWGSLYVTLANGVMTPEKRARLTALAPASTDVAEAVRGGAGAGDVALQRFQEARRSRRTKLSAAELHRLIGGLIGVARQSGPLSEAEVLRLRRLGGELGIAAAAVDMMIAS